MSKSLEQSASGAPKPLDHVYHITLSDRLAALTEGLKPRAIPRADNLGDQNWLLDKVRPQSVRRMGLSRQRAVYAHADAGVIERVFERRTGGSVAKGAQHLVALEISVNPDEVLVCDAFSISYIGLIAIKGQKREYSPGSSESALKYWENALTLSQYRQMYDVEIGGNGLYCVKNSDGQPEMPYTFFQPEVLIPGPVAPERIKWFAASASKINGYVKW